MLGCVLRERAGKRVFRRVSTYRYTLMPLCTHTASAVRVRVCEGRREGEIVCVRLNEHYNTSIP